MPGRLKTASEYHKKFRWNDSVKSASFTPSKEQKAPQAGMSSANRAESFAITREPPLQRRRKPITGDNKMTYTTRQYLVEHDSDESTDVGKASRTPKAIPGTTFAKTFVKRDRIAGKSSQLNDKDVKTETNRAIAAQTRVISKPKKQPRPIIKAPPPLPTKATKGPSIARTDKPVKAGGDAPQMTLKAQPETDEALQYRAGIRARPGGPKYSSEYQRQFAWKQPSSKETPLMAADQMVHMSNANLAPYVPDKIPRHSEYQRQFMQQPAMPSVKEQLMQNAQQEIKAKYRVKTKSKKGKKMAADARLQPAGVPSVTSHDDPRLVKSIQNPQRPFFPHATTRKWRSEYNSNFKSPQVFRYENGVWKGADPPQVQPRDDVSDTDKAEPLKRSKSVGDIPSWFSEVLELRQRAQDYQKRARGTHFSREHLAQLLADQAKLWEESSADQRSVSSSISTQTSGSEKKDEQEKEVLQPRGKESTSDPMQAKGEVSPIRRKLAWPSDSDRPDGLDQNRNGGNLPRKSSASSFTSPGSVLSTSSLSSEFESISGNGRPPTPTLKDRPPNGPSRHHLDRTTPATGGAILTSPAPRRRTTQASRSSDSQPRQSEGQMKPSSRTYVSRPATVKAIIPGGISKEFDYDSDDEDDSDNEIDRTLTNLNTTPPAKPPFRAQQTRVLQASPSAGVQTADPHPINEELSRPAFQRHSERFFETSPGMPSLPDRIRPPSPPSSSSPVPPAQAWEAPTREGLKTAPAGRGPLERPHSGSIAGRPQTAVPATRQQTSHREQRLNSFMSGESPDTWGENLTPPGGRQGGVRGGGRRGSDDELSMSTISNASSSTLASEVLERATRRRDDFWGKEKRE